LSGEKHYPIPGGSVGPDRFNGFENWLRFEEHAFAAAEGTVVDGSVAVVGEGAEVMGVHPDDALAQGSLQDAIVQGAAKEAGKERDDIEAHKRRD
jgi:hypothetical protein